MSAKIAATICGAISFELFGSLYGCCLRFLSQTVLMGLGLFPGLFRRALTSLLRFDFRLDPSATAFFLQLPLSRPIFFLDRLSA